MSFVRYVDNGVFCNHDGCNDLRYGSQLGLGDEPSLAVVRTELRRLGWKTGVENKTEDATSITRGARLDFCPAHAGDAA